MYDYPIDLRCKLIAILIFWGNTYCLWIFLLSCQLVVFLYWQENDVTWSDLLIMEKGDLEKVF